MVGGRFLWIIQNLQWRQAQISQRKMRLMQYRAVSGQSLRALLSI